MLQEEYIHFIVVSQYDNIFESIDIKTIDLGYMISSQAIRISEQLGYNHYKLYCIENNQITQVIKEG